MEQTQERKNGTQLFDLPDSGYGTATGPHVVLNIGYDNLQRQTSLSATVAGTLDFLNNYAYDAAGDMTKITQQSQTGGNSVAPKVVNLTYNADGQYTAVNRYANLTATQLVATSTYGYDANGMLTSLSHDKGSTNLESYTWSYDHMGRLTADTIGTASDSYSYDAASEVTAATHSGGGNESYSYDSNGNRTNTGYSTGTNNQLSSDGTYNYLYDNEGNLTKKTTISTSAYVNYTWDYHNRLTDVKAYNVSNVLQSHEHYVYDVFDRMIERQVDPTGGGTYTTTQAFIYSGSNVILVYNGSGTLTDRLLTLPPLPSGGGPGWGANNALADENGSGTVSWFLTDREGTTNDVIQYNSGTNTTTVVDHLTYSSFGGITSQTNSAYQPLFAYTGQMWDPAAGLYYYHARWYDASTGRFISQDPKGFAAGDANLYRYVDNSPTNLIDPNGTDANATFSSAQWMGWYRPQQEKAVAYVQRGWAADELEMRDIKAVQDANMAIGPTAVKMLNWFATEIAKEAASQAITLGMTRGIGAVAGRIGNAAKAARAARAAQQAKQAAAMAKIEAQQIAKSAEQRMIQQQYQQQQSRHKPGRDHRPEHLIQSAKEKDAIRRARLQIAKDAAQAEMQAKWNAMSDQLRNLYKGKKGIDPSR